MAPFSNWIALLSTPFLVQDFVVHALPNPESLLDQRSSGAAPAPRVLLPRGRNAIDGLTSTDLVKREPAEPPASNGVPGKHSTTHTTGREHRVGGKPPSPNQQKAVAKGRHPPQTRLTAIEAARGGTVIKSGSDQVGSAKPAGKGLGESKIGLGDPPHPAPAENPCARFPMETDVDFVGTVYYSLIKGAVHQLSEPECPPGSIGHTYSFSTSWSVSGQIGPDMKATLPGLTRFKKYLDKLGIRAGVAYSWTNTQSTTYTGSETGGQSHPFVLTYRPLILVVTGDIQVTKYVTAFKERTVCSVDHPTRIDLHLPTHANDDCASKKTACGPGGVIWDHCFFLGAEARYLCPDRKLGPPPEPGRQCPASWYFPQFIDAQGRIKS